MYDTLTEWDFETLKPKPGLPRKLELHRSDDPRAQHPSRCDLPRRYPARRRGGEVQPEPKADPKSNIKADLATMASAEVTGPMQITLKLSAPDAAMPGISHDRAGMMVSPAAVKATAPAIGAYAGRRRAPMRSSAGRTASGSWSSATRNTGSQTARTPTVSNSRSFPS